MTSRHSLVETAVTTARKGDLRSASGLGSATLVSSPPFPHMRRFVPLDSDLFTLDAISESGR